MWGEMKDGKIALLKDERLDVEKREFFIKKNLTSSIQRAASY